MSKNDDEKEKRDTHRCQKIQGTIVVVHRIFPNHFWDEQLAADDIVPNKIALVPTTRQVDHGVNTA